MMFYTRFSTIFPKSFLFLGIVLLLFLSCKKEQPDVNVKPVEKTVLIYISANNDLKYAALSSIDQMESAYREAYGNLLVFVKIDRYTSNILRIKPDLELGILNSDTLKSYENQNASDADFMKIVLDDMKILSPSKEYSLILWSHGTSWLPNVDWVSTKSFGYDRGVETNIADLKRVIPDNLSYILFDACYMSSVEVIYELKNKTDYVIASNAEVLHTSFPYHKIVPYLFGDIDDLKKVCSIYYDFYNNKNGLERSCTISLVYTKELDNLASATREILGNNLHTQISRQVQDFNFLKNLPIEFFDYEDLFRKNFDKLDSERITKLLSKCVLYKAATPNFLTFPIHAFSGLSISIPIEYKYQTFYKTLSWYDHAKIQFF